MSTGQFELPRPALTSDVYDAYPEQARVPDTAFISFGARPQFAGTVVTLDSREDNLVLKAMLDEDGHGKVLVVEGGGTLHCAMVGGNMAARAAKSGWEGLVIHGAVRDRLELAAVDLGVFALGSNPRRSAKAGIGTRDVPVSFGGITISPGDLLVADEDGVVVLTPGGSAERSS